MLSFDHRAIWAMAHILTQVQLLLENVAVYYTCSVIADPSVWIQRLNSNRFFKLISGVDQRYRPQWQVGPLGEDGAEK